jgi:FkbM family methyltransferase
MQGLKTLTVIRALRDRTLFLDYLWLKLCDRGRSYAAGAEDLTIRDLIGDVRWFIDIGAGGHYSGSNTFYFALRRARGICFEPLPEHFTRLRSLYALAPRVTCRKVGISDVSCDAEMISLGAWSYLPDTEDATHTALYPGALQGKSSHIQLLCFEDAMSGLEVPPAIDVLSIDVEGHELNVLRSIPFDRFSFRLIVVETHEIDPQGHVLWKSRDFGSINDVLCTNGYSPVFINSANTFWLSTPLAVGREVGKQLAAFLQDDDLTFIPSGPRVEASGRQ